MSKMNEIELILILGFYFFNKGRNVESFTIRFNQYFKKDISAQTILFSIAKFRNVDPTNNMRLKSENNEYKLVWDEYIGNDKVPELRDIYRSFNKGRFVNTNHSYNDIPDGEKIIVVDSNKLSINDIPKVRPEEFLIGITAYRRNREVVYNALAYADYLCEAKCNTVLFLRKNYEVTYTEAHHLIPLCYQDEFVYSLDVEANIVSLCPNCHSGLHYGHEPKSILSNLYEERKKRLKLCGIDITFEKLLLLYR